jgi:hypothetical protein
MREWLASNHASNHAPKHTHTNART